MGDEMLLRFKPRRQYEWYQDPSSIFVGLEFKNTTIKKLEIEICDLVLKVNHRERKLVVVIDLLHEVATDSRNEVTYANNLLRVRLTKLQPGQHWDSLEPELETHEKLARREQSFRRREEEFLKLKKQQEDNRHQYDRMATREMMRLEDESRKKLQSIKRDQKEQEEQRIFGETSSAAVQPQAKPKRKEPPKALISAEEQQRIDKLVEQHEREEETQLANKLRIKKQQGMPLTAKNQIFSKEEVQATSIQNDDFESVPAREAGKFKVKFTEKVYPHLAAREQHFKDPPMPKSKRAQVKEGELEERNPLFLKDKGDYLFSNGDFGSAIAAYAQVLKLDPDSYSALSNRALCHMRLFNYEEADKDCKELLAYLKGKPDLAAQKSQLIRKVNLRRAACLAWGGKLSDALLALQEAGQDEQTTAMADAIKRRAQSLKTKELADFQLSNGAIQPAMQKYREAINQDQNEFARSNLALCHLKREQFAETLEQCESCLKVLNKFARPSKIDKAFSSTGPAAQNLFFKCYLRKACALKRLGKVDQAMKAVGTALMIDGESREAQQLKGELEKELTLRRTKEMRESAKKFIEEGKFEEALEQYNECLKILPQSEVLDYLSVLQNRLVCYLRLERLDDIVSTCIRGLKIIRVHRDRIVSFDEAKVSKSQQETLVELEVRFLFRRANAYFKLGQFYNCRSDIEEALALSPADPIKAELMKIRSQLV